MATKGASLFRRVLAVLGWQSESVPIQSQSASQAPLSGRLQWRTDDESAATVTVAGIEVSTSITMTTPSQGFLRVVGESHYQDALSAAKTSLADDDQPVLMATLVPEPMNSHDSNAVMVIIEPFGQIGYLARESAKRYVSRLRPIPPCDARCSFEARRHLLGPFSTSRGRKARA